MHLLLTGDSIIARHEKSDIPRINYELKKIHPNFQITNTAISGINSGGLFSLLPQLVFNQEKCDYLIILVGANDLATHKQVPISQFEANLNLIASSIVWLYYPPKVILISPPAVDEDKQHVRNNNLVRQYSQIIEKRAKTYKFSYIDLAQAMINTNNLKQICHGEKNDGLHFGILGYQLLADLIANKINALCN